MNIFITTHAKQRYRERFLDNSHNVNILPIMLKDIHSGKDITQKIYNDVPRFILYLYEKYEELGITIIQSDDKIFLLKKKDKTIDCLYVITCIKSENYLNQFKNTSLSREDIFLKIKNIKSKLRFK